MIFHNDDDDYNRIKFKQRFLFSIEFLAGGVSIVAGQIDKIWENQIKINVKSAALVKLTPEW